MDPQELAVTAARSESHVAGAGLPDVNLGPKILISTSIVTWAAFFVVAVRMYVRVFVIRNVGLDDWTMVLTMALSLSGWAITIPEVLNGAGRHTIYVEKTASKAMHLNFATELIYLWAIAAVKISIGFFLLRFAPRRGYRVFISVVMVAMTVYTLICNFTILFQCKKMETLWNPNVPSKCFSPTQLLALAYTNAGLNILTDLIFAILPGIMLRHLQVNKRTKASLACILGLGVFACAAAFVKLSILPNYGKTGDFLWDYSDLTIWVVTECNVGIIAGSLPTLKPLFKQVLNTYASRSKSKPYYGTGGESYQLRKHSRSGSKPLSSVDLETSETSHRTRQQYEATSYARPGGKTSSEESILPAHGARGIIMTREIQVLTETGSGERADATWGRAI
ncbi:hypothetical protein ASPZODRAFT_96276 [Penicilliopsis zonata CBS 506.65]|uniref:Rhodopsin domain-containing protein n=1 Tax=Penicilliopsis zonata CBS 506.65 TaxID=1073090 RepID=A0A1L9SJR0_9EURO|nr:hypothetical protein ASPZODRAFT_96276 [Penicilliopsis zonata CBS 506.65]OJJ47333.1 hypothetical protein ASPZODRAFT_96276 [Penicilliopsis zonata CBS 506.65]